ncbi:MAG: virulence-associated E family protein [Polyangiaceae bacterium]
MLEDFAIVGLGATDPIEVVMVRKFMIAAVRRILSPGTKVDSVLVLKGEQGAGKSSLLYALSPDRRWVQEGVPDLENKDAQESLRGRWLVELPELQTLLRKREEAVKDFLSREEDSYRRPYDRGATRAPRQCVFIATTNDDEILRDPTGARRYWIVRVAPKMNLGWVREKRDAIWRAALDLAIAGELHYLTPEEETALRVLQEPFQQGDPWDNAIAGFVEGKAFVTTADVWGHLRGTLFDTDVTRDLSSLTKADERRITTALRRLGWKGDQKEKRGEKRVKGWKPPSSVPAVPAPSPT